MKAKLLTVITLLCATALSVISCPTTVTAQNSRNRVIRNQNRDDSPVRLSNLKVNGRAVSFDRIFQTTDGAGWLNNLTVEVRNVSGRDIYYIKILLDIPLGEPGSGIYSMPLVYGRIPMPQNSASANATPLRPGQTVTLTTGPRAEEGLRGLLQRRGIRELPSMDRLAIYTEMVFFNATTMWGRGRIYNPHSSEQGRWVPTERETNLRQNPQAAPPRFIRTSGSRENSRLRAGQECPCVTREYFIIECECQIIFGKPTTGECTDWGLHGEEDLHWEPCDPWNPQCGYVEYQRITDKECRTEDPE